MYKDLLDYFENECCISNIFMKKYWKIWYVALLVLLVLYVIFMKLNLLWISILLLAVFLICNIYLLIRLSNLKIKEELKYDGVTINWVSFFSQERFKSAYYEFQMSKLSRYLKDKNIKNEEIEKFVKYVDEDLINKYPKDKLKENFMSVIVPATISVIAVYLTNNEIKDLKIIGTTVILSIIYAFIISFSIRGLNSLKYAIVNPRRNLLDLKDVLRNIKVEYRKG